ncbi:M949_RS01915 family surface polysaccharide biosynthesis protein [Pantoea sp.]|uniref:M949_RS01915 family surface polysaccharide biosynthesis protein n=1 Tax=Pantoea sp. TaxID=69393 RepID=UPI0025E67163|nr:hypothetical protein [Pantoea sp.]
MNGKIIVILMLILPQLAFASPDIVQKVWSDNSGKHTVIIDKQLDSKGGGENLLIKQITNNREDWILRDYVRGCEEDVKLDVVVNSIEVNKSLSDDIGTVLFAYKIGCVGGIDPVTVKYFAFRNGMKYSLRGEEHIIVGSDGFGGEKAPAPDFNLRNDKSLLEYMMKKWTYISTTKIN